MKSTCSSSLVVVLCSAAALCSLVQAELGSDNLDFGSCSTFCDCEQELSVTCRGGEVDTVPNDLSPYITKLVLEGNKIKYIGNMETYSSLEKLDISNNQLVEVKPECFRSNRDLVELDLSHNRLGTLDMGDLEGLTSLAHLDLGHNQVDNITASTFSHQEALQSLKLGHNRLSSLHRNVFYGAVKNTIRDLDLSSNLFQRVPREALSDLVDLTILDLSNNQIGQLNSGEFDSIRGHLQQLRLAGCLLHEVGPAAFQGLDSLRLLDLSNNGLSNVPNRAFNNLRMLEELRIGRNKIAQFSSKDFLSLKQLKHLHMEGCNVDTFTLVGDVFSENTDMERLTLSRCKGFTQIEREVEMDHLSVLREVNLHGCGLNGLSEHLFGWQDLQLVDLSDNPVSCDCGLLGLLEAQTHNPGLELRGQCEGPASLARKEIRRVREKDLVCDEVGVSSLLVGGLVTAALMSVVLIVLGVLMWRRRPWKFGHLFGRSAAKKKKKLSTSFSGSKKDIMVVQNKVEEEQGFLQLPGLDTLRGHGLETETDPPTPSENLYAEVTETVPQYGIPLVNGNFPDVKISVI